MKVPFTWLREYCDPGLGPDEVAELLSMRAVEVERVTPIGVLSTDGFVVGRVLTAEQHPNADRLRVCEVDVGDGSRTIVCGAPNVAAEHWVAVALPGAGMPGGEKLEKAKLRGVESNGMILSERELGIGDDADGILVLGTTNVPPASSASRPGAGGSGSARGLLGDELMAGRPLAEVLPIQDTVLELDLNPNRVDCFGVYGVAREVHAITGAPLAEAPWRSDAEPADEEPVEQLASVRVEVPDLCPRYTARAFTGVTVRPSPRWLQTRLIAAGQRPISNIVDITNYVMLLTAQPIHAFDLDEVPGGEVIIRSARDGERMTTLDGVERSFDAETVLVCDRERPSGVAGIMGGQVSEVSGQTTRVLLEAANWNGANILRTSAKLGLRSEASTRFEKQLHPEIAIRAQRLASKLIVELAGATLAPGTIDEAGEIPAAHVISLNGARVESLLGVAVDPAEAGLHLERLGFEVERGATSDEQRVVVPLHRHYDVTREVDVIEEVGRLHGFDRLPRTLPGHAERIGGLTREQRLRRRAEDALRDLGFDEVVAWSFVAPELATKLRLPEADPRSRAVATKNPISAEHELMRTTLLGGLLDAARHNFARGRDRLAVFESGRVYVSEPAPADGGPLAGDFAGRMPAPASEPTRLAGLIVGELVPRSWASAAASPLEFFSLTGALELLASALEAPFELAPGAEPFLHPGRAATIRVGGADAGWLGELHPLIAREWDLPDVAAFELDLATLLAASGLGEESYEDLTTFPAVLQDLAVTVPEEVSAAEVREAVRASGGSLLVGAEVFDLYHGEQVGAGKKSLALQLEFRAADRTLTDEEVAAVRTKIKAALAAIGGALRE